jgi:hypothetical protein
MFTFANKNVNVMNTTTITPPRIEITLEENAVVSDIKKALKMIRGVASVRVANPSKAEVPNKTTIKAINDVKAGKTFKASSVDDLLSQCLE